MEMEVERQALLGGYSVERIVHDYGIDLRFYAMVRRFLVERGLVEGNEFETLLQETAGRS